MNDISIRDARRLLLNRQGLLRRAQFGRGKGAAHKAVEQLGYVQIDTISVVDRSHHHVLKTRVPNYAGAMLDRLQGKDREVFEYWAHAASYLPIEDYRYYQPMMLGWRRRRTWDRKLAGEIRRRIESEGPLQSKHFEDPRNRKSNGWWDWKPAKLVLENMFLAGEIMVTRREGFQKVYDLRENVLPPDVDTTMPGHEEWLRFMAMRSLRAAGIGTLHDVSYARTAVRRFTGLAIRGEIERTLNALIEEGVISEVLVDGAKWYADSTLLAELPLRMGKRQMHFLSPFDNVVINRERMNRLFDFDYQLECYVPAPKRRFGYFCLPILWGDEFVGRMDSKAIRKEGVFEINCLFLERGVNPGDDLVRALRDGILGFARRNNCETARILKSEPAPLAAALSLEKTG